MRTAIPLLLLACSNDPKSSETPIVGDSSGQESGTPADSHPAESGATETGTGESGSGETAPAETSSGESGSAESADPDSAVPAETADTGDTGVAEELPASAETCFGEYYGDTGEPYPDYEATGATFGSHCSGTDHQDIADVDRVVFVGDSITVGSPPTDPNDFYRSVMAENLSAEFGLEAPEWTWEWYDIVEGTAYEMNSGDFWSCAKWGARTDDLMEDNDQILDCMPTEEWDRTTLVIMTMGGNDLFNLVEAYTEGKSIDELYTQTVEMTEKLRVSVEYLKDPANWGAPVYVVFANVYEFTDGTGDWGSCPGADLAGLDDALADPEFSSILAWMEEEYLNIAVETGADMTFMYEAFCGHGYGRDSADARCDRGDDAELWFDLTCIHPNEYGHAAIADLFQDVVDE